MKIDNPHIKGKYLAKNAIRTFNEDFVDEDNGEIVTINRNEIIASRGALLDMITIELLKANNIEDIEVSDEQRLGYWMNTITRYEVTAIVPRKEQSGRIKKQTEMYLLFSESASTSEQKIVDELEKSCQGNFKISKVGISKIDNVIHGDGDKWFKSVIKYLIDDGEGKMNLLVKAFNIDNASESIRLDPNMPNDIIISEIKDTKFVEVYESKN